MPNVRDQDTDISVIDVFLLYTGKMPETEDKKNREIESPLKGVEADMLHPQNIKTLYDQLINSFGKGDNGLFDEAPPEAVIANYHPNGEERPFFYVLGSDGYIKKWLSVKDLEKIKKTELLKDPQILEKVLYDMFTLMLGGIEPKLNELNVKSLPDLIKDAELADDVRDRLAKLLNFVDSNPDTSLTKWLYLRIGLSFSCQAYYNTTVAGNESQVIVVGVGSYADNKLIVWEETVRNGRRGTPSPVKQDGEGFLGKPFDILLGGYKFGGHVRWTRLNSTVFYLARHGLSEDEKNETKADQVYISLDEYFHVFFNLDESKRADVHRRREENFVIKRKAIGFERIKELRREEMVRVLIDLDTAGEIGPWLSEIDEYLASDNH